jgi:hypothetical protein
VASRREKMKSRSAVVLAIAAILGGATALAQVAPSTEDAKQSKEKKRATGAKVTVKDSPSAPAGGLVVFIDPVTGKIRQPDAAEIGQLVSPGGVKVQPPKPLVQVALPGGGFMVKLDSSFESYSVVTRSPDGKLVMDCVTGEKAAKNAITNGVKPSEKPEAKEALDVQ